LNNFFWKLAKRAAEIAGDPIKPEHIYCQWAHETNNFTSELMEANHNLGGLCQIEPNDTPQPDGNQYYMKFDTYEDYADYFGRYLRLYEADGIYEAQNIDEYVLALKTGGYFGDSYENYVAGCKNFLREEFNTVEIA
jgi:hypothetical protein